MPNVDPGQLLKALEPLLEKSGGMRNVDSASRIVSLMKDTTKMVSKCTYLNIVLSTQSDEVLQKFISLGGWMLLNKWLHEAKNADNLVFIKELLKIYQLLPVSVDYLKMDNTARSIKSLIKHGDKGVQQLSSSVVQGWMKKIKGKGNDHTENDKLKNERAKEGRMGERQKTRHSRDKAPDHALRDHHHHHTEEKDALHDTSDNLRLMPNLSDPLNVPATLERLDTSDCGSDAVSKSISVFHSGHGTCGVRPEGADERSQQVGASDTLSPQSGFGSVDGDGGRKRPRTARVYSSKFRSVFDEDEPVPSVKRKSPEELTKARGLARKSNVITKTDSKERIPRLSIKTPALICEKSIDVDIDDSLFPLEVTHGKIKIIPPKAPPAHEIHDSNVFMKELTKSTYTHGPMKRKKKPQSPSSRRKNASATPEQATGSAQSPLATDPAVMSSAETAAIQLSSVPTFYRDTLEAERQANVERSPPSLERIEEPNLDKSIDEQMVHSEPPTIEIELPIAADHPSPPSWVSMATDNDASTDQPHRSLVSMDKSVYAAAIEAVGNGRDRKLQKHVTWADESVIKQIFYFELDETERENVNRPKTFSEMLKQDRRSEGKAMENVRRLFNNTSFDVLPWRTPPPIDGLLATVESGSSSKERSIEQQRQSHVLQAIYFSKQMMPDAPAEADPENVEPTETKIIPLVDEKSTGVDYVHQYSQDSFGNVPYDPGFDITENINVPGGGGFVARSNSTSVQLPPDISGMLTWIEQQRSVTGGQQGFGIDGHTMSTIQKMLMDITNPSPGANTDALINNLRSVLEPLKANMPGTPVSGYTNHINGLNAPPQIVGVPPSGRFGLLGNAPHGYNSVPGTPGCGFGPQGPEMDREWNGFHGMQQSISGPNICRPDMINTNMGGPPPGMGGPPPVMGGPPPGMEGPYMGMHGPRWPSGPDYPGAHSPGSMMEGCGWYRGTGQRGRFSRAMRRGRPILCRNFNTPQGCRFGNACFFLHSVGDEESDFDS